MEGDKYIYDVSKRRLYRLYRDKCCYDTYAAWYKHFPQRFCCLHVIVLVKGYGGMVGNARTYIRWKKYEDLENFVTNLTLFSASTYSTVKVIEQLVAHDCFASFEYAMSIVAIAQAIKSGVNFTQAAVTLLSSEATGKELNDQRRKVLFHGLRFIGYTLISFGFFSAGAAFLGAALAITLYNHSPSFQECRTAITHFFTRRPSSTLVAGSTPPSPNPALTLSGNP